MTGRRGAHELQVNEWRSLPHGLNRHGRQAKSGPAPLNYDILGEYGRQFWSVRNEPPTQPAYWMSAEWVVKPARW